MFSSPLAPSDQLLWELLAFYLKETAVQLGSLVLNKSGDSVALGKGRTVHC